MAFVSALIQTLFKLVVVGAAAFGGIFLGRYIRKIVDDKKSKE